MAAAALALTGCGGDEPQGRPGQDASAPAAGRPAPGPEEGAQEPPRGERQPRESGRAGSAGGPPSPGPAGAGGCAYQAPPGRLSEERVALELRGVSCDQAVALARAATLGQPAGANLTIARDGFECEPSSREPGENVTYICSGEAGRVSFRVVWSEGG